MLIAGRSNLADFRYLLRTKADIGGTFCTLAFSIEAGDSSDLHLPLVPGAGAPGPECFAHLLLNLSDLRLPLVPETTLGPKALG